MGLFSRRQPLPGAQGTVRVDTRTAALLTRLRTGDVAVIDHLDLDRASAEALLVRRPAAVLNAARSTSGRYPNLGPSLLVAAGVPLVDDLGPDVLTLREGRTIRVHEGRVYDGDRLVAEGTVQDEASVAAAAAAARAGLAAHLEAFAAGTVDHLRRERELLLDGVGIPAISTDLTDKHVVVVTRGHHHDEDLAALRRYLREYRPVLVGVDGGAEVLLAAGLRPHLVVTDLDAATDQVLTCGAEIVIRTDPNLTEPNVAGPSTGVPSTIAPVTTVSDPIGSTPTTSGAKAPGTTTPGTATPAPTTTSGLDTTTTPAPGISVSSAARAGTPAPGTALPDTTTTPASAPPAPATPVPSVTAPAATAPAAIAPNATTPNLDRLTALGVGYVVFPATATAEDAALLLADHHGAALIVAVGSHTSLVEFLDKGRVGMASSFLTRLRVGTRLVDATAVARLYRRRVSVWQLLLLVAAGLGALVVALAVTPAGRSLLVWGWAGAQSLWQSVTALFGG